MKYILIAITLAVLSGCGAARAMQTERDIEEAYQKGEITKKEYLELRIKFEDARSGSYNN